MLAPNKNRIQATGSRQDPGDRQPAGDGFVTGWRRDGRRGGLTDRCLTGVTVRRRAVGRQGPERPAAGGRAVVRQAVAE